MTNQTAARQRDTTLFQGVVGGLADLAQSVVGGLADLAGLVWPVRCAGCGRPDVRVCGPCRGSLARGIRHAPVPAWPDGPGVWAVAAYAGAPARLIVSWKDRGRHDVTGVLAEALTAPLTACRAAGADGPWRARDGPWLLVPVPTARVNRRRRGGDLVSALTGSAARELARGVVAREGLGGTVWQRPPILLDALRHVRRVRDQSSLTADERRANVHGALVVRGRVRRELVGSPVVLVDDVVTTGATLAEAARALHAVGALVVGACCLCVTERQQGVSDGRSLG